eukprot:2040883-Karenia_brevis.AAC.1
MLSAANEVILRMATQGFQASANTMDCSANCQDMVGVSSGPFAPGDWSQNACTQGFGSIFGQSECGIPCSVHKPTNLHESADSLPPSTSQDAGAGVCAYSEIGQDASQSTLFDAQDGALFAAPLRPPGKWITQSINVDTCAKGNVQATRPKARPPSK